jgi:glycerol-3-phosphate acyltransferase PlsY
MLYLYIGLAVAAAYLAGSVPFGFITAKVVKGIDIREKGSGNIGATNVGRVMGKPWGVAVFLLDFCKGFLPVFFFVRILRLVTGPENIGELCGNIVMVLTGLAVLIGNMFPVFLKFKGGKGVAASSGIFCALSWKVVLTAFVVWVVIVLVSKYVSLGSIIAAGLSPFLFILYGYSEALTVGLPFTLFAAVMAVLVAVRHKSNIQRLIQGTENKVLAKKE